MNLFKIALKNIKKSWNDYTVYFLTLIIGVSIFYMFNSVGTQGIMQDVSKSGNTSVQMLISAVGVVSIAVAIVLGLLIIYANNFLIKRRKKEFGIYLMLGMKKKKVSRILICETGLVGVISLFIGLLIGIFGSQLLSIIVAKMFAVDVTKYKFDISVKAIIITIISFVIIYLVVLFFNTRVVSKYKLIDLINAEKVQEKQIVKNTKVSMGLFVFSIILLLFGYVRVAFYGKDMKNGFEFFIHAVIIVVATFILFWSLAGFFQTAISGRKAFYRKGLNAFVIRQFSGNMNTSAFSMALISILLLGAICAFSSGFSFRTYLNKKLKNATPVDLTMRIWCDDSATFLEDKSIPLSDWASEYLILPVYESNEVSTGKMVEPVIEEAKGTFMHADWDSPENVMRLSDYNKIEKAYGRKKLSVGENEYAVVSDFDLLNQFLISSIKMGNVLNIDGRDYTPAYDTVNYEYILLSGLSANMGVVVLPDSVIDNENGSFTKKSELIIANYIASTKGERYDTDEKLMDKIGSLSEASMNGDLGEDETKLMIITKNQVEDSSIGTSVIVVFLVLYIGIVFVVSCAAIIALKAMSDSIDSTRRFKILSRVGASEEMRKKALFMQILMNFMLPLIVALIGSLFILRFIKGVLASVGMVSLGPGIAVSTMIMVIIYGGYFLTTFNACKKFA